MLHHPEEACRSIQQKQGKYALCKDISVCVHTAMLNQSAGRNTKVLFLNQAQNDKEIFMCPHASGSRKNAAVGTTAKPRTRGLGHMIMGQA